jgi:hypothetical protein
MPFWQSRPGLLHRGAASAVLVLALLLKLAPLGPEALSPAALGSGQPICAAHEDPATTPGDEDQAPAPKPHDLCCVLLCGFGGVSSPNLLPAADVSFPPPTQQAFAYGRDGTEFVQPRLSRARHGACAPPGLA